VIVLPRDTAERVDALLARMDRSIASRVGAGQTINAAWDERRWGGELRRELASSDVEELLARLQSALAGATTPTEVHQVFARLRERVAALAG
jgi:hypothetical protein